VAILQWARSERTEADSAAAMIALAAGGAAPLAGALREVHALEHRYENVQRISGEDSVLATIARLANRGRILHIAAHARVNDDSPWQSGFWLDETGMNDGEDAPSARSPAADADTAAASEDGMHSTTVLRAWEIARAHLPYGLAVLAGCETAGGRATRGEGVLGMTSAFLSAGVPVVVSSLWSVDDRVTARLMSHFYDRLAAGEDVAAALRGAQLAIRSDARTAHPFYWAGFSVVGDGSRVIRPQAVKRSWAPWVVLGLALTGLAGWLVLSRRRSAAAVVM